MDVDPASRASAAVQAAGIPAALTRHGPVASLAEAAEERGLRPEQVLKTIVVRRSDDDYVFVLVPGGRAIDWPKLRKVLAVNRMSLPDAATALAVTGYERGTITPFGSLRRLPVLADAAIPAGQVSIGGGAHGTAFTVDREDLVRTLDAQVADVTRPE